MHNRFSKPSLIENAQARQDYEDNKNNNNSKREGYFDCKEKRRENTCYWRAAARQQSTAVSTAHLQKQMTRKTQGKLLTGAMQRNENVTRTYGLEGLVQLCARVS